MDPNCCMRELLYHFCPPLHHQKSEEMRQDVNQHLTDEQRKLVLHLVDQKNAEADEAVFRAFRVGFRLGAEIFCALYETPIYEEGEMTYDEEP